MIFPSAREGLHQWARQHLWQYPQHSRSYRRWRRGFVRDRLTLAIWVAILGQLFLEAIDMFLVIPLANWSQSSGFQINWADAGENLQILGISIFCLFLGWLALKYSRRDPIRLLPWFTLSNLIFPDQFHVLAGLRAVDLGAVSDMAIVFWCQAILVPVQWRVHLLSHVMTFLCFIALGMMSGFTEMAETDPTTILLWVSWFTIYSAFAIGLANILIWYAERLLWKEFSLRERLQQFLQTVSHDLRSPIQQSQQMLNQLKFETSPTADAAITLAPATVKQLLSHSQQQLDLLNHLLAAARPDASLEQSQDQPKNQHD